MASIAARAGRGLSGAYPALGYPTFRVYWGGTLVSLTGMWMQSLAQGWLVFDLTDSPLMLGLVGAFWAAPNIALSLVGGVVADRVDRRRLLVATRSVGVAVSLSVGLLVATGLIQVWHVFVASTVMGTVAAFDMPATQALVPALVHPRHLMNAIALNSAAFSGTRIIGPSLAGVLVDRVGVAGCYFVASLSTLVMVVALATLAVPRLKGGARGGLAAQARDGLAYVRRDELRVGLLGMQLVNSLFGMAYPTMLPIFARDVLLAGARGYGSLMAASGLGSLVGTLTVATFGQRLRPGWLTLGCSATFGLALVAFASSRSLETSLLLLAVAGLANAVYGTLINTLLQSSLDEAYRGRAMSVFTLAMNTMPLAGLQAGLLATAFGAPLALTANGVVVVVSTAVAAALVPRLRRA